jgi:hypothetical protein
MSETLNNQRSQHHFSYLTIGQYKSFRINQRKPFLTDPLVVKTALVASRMLPVQCASYAQAGLR